jgi:hypothetical protein
MASMWMSWNLNFNHLAKHDSGKLKGKGPLDQKRANTDN